MGLCTGGGAGALYIAAHGQDLAQGPLCEQTTEKLTFLQPAWWVVMIHYFIIKYSKKN